MDFPSILRIKFHNGGEKKKQDSGTLWLRLVIKSISSSLRRREIRIGDAWQGV